MWTKSNIEEEAEFAKAELSNSYGLCGHKATLKKKQKLPKPSSMWTKSNIEKEAEVAKAELGNLYGLCGRKATLKKKQKLPKQSSVICTVCVDEKQH